MDDEEQQNEEVGAGEGSADEGGTGGSSSFPLVEFLLWLGFAIVADIFSLIPWLGALISEPFEGGFLLYKALKGLNLKKTVWATIFAAVLEAIFSTLPACTADVVATYFLSKASEKISKVVPAKAIAMAGAAKGVGGVKGTEGELKTGAKGIEGKAKAGAKAAEETATPAGAPTAEMPETGPAAGAETKGLPPEEFGLPPEERAPGIRATPEEGAPSEETPETAGKPGVSPERELEMKKALGEPTPLEDLPQELGLGQEIPATETETTMQNEEEKENQRKKTDAGEGTNWRNTPEKEML